MTPIYIESIGVLAPGLVGWPQTRAVLTGEVPYTPTPLAALKPARLAPDVRRRTTDHIRIAVEVATEATHALGDGARELASVFASAESDGAITHDICLEVAKDSPQVSPTRFHNSVNNAPAGYWCMAIGSQAPSTSVAGYDGSFAVGLLEAALQLLTDTPRVLLVVHDTPLPEPLHSVRPFPAIFGAAFVLTAAPGLDTLARLELDVTNPQKETSLDNSALETLRAGNPAARALSLLAAVAGKHKSEIYLPYLVSRTLAVRVETPA
ncbi:MAG TPA: beta-ketoacyl synthase chain length factor [Burkholderiales bacterium]|nr:beta-ketoacyl synthase chain length factor [Burkholderiales bacterium]